LVNTRTSNVVVNTRKPLTPEDSLSSDIHPILRRVYLNRGISNNEQLDRSLNKLPSFESLSGIDKAVDLLIEAIQKDKKILIVADFDADGATSCAVGVRGLRLLGAKNVDYVVPDRFKFGYGLTPEIAEVALQQKPDLIVTVDNGISSVDGVAYVVSKGCKVIVTDHHLPPEQLPMADAIVNPQLKEDGFPSKALAGVGVIFYVLLAVRSRYKVTGQYEVQSAPNLANLLDIVALGTVADVVPLDEVNRRLVHQGLLRIQQGKCVPGIRALLQQAKRDPKNTFSSDLGFVVGPRLNAAGRLDDMSLGIECLLTNDDARAVQIAEQLDLLNQERRTIEDGMKIDAYKILEKLNIEEAGANHWGVCLYDNQWHQGVIGILASRIKEKLNRPVIAFAKASDGEIKGSARSIKGLHIRDTLDDIACQHPALLKKFGGHAMAAGMSLLENDLEQFTLLFNEAVKKRLESKEPENVFLVDGDIPDNDINLNLAELLRQGGPWGQAFEEPLFIGTFSVKNARILGQKHVKFDLETMSSRRRLDAIYFNVDNPDNFVGRAKMTLVYQLGVNTYLGHSKVQLMIRHVL
jgi:single-stranded-DNA-specific exonuclease